ncbi:MAG: patatin-like phospholipase family protein [Myxococcales bacterium]|nr:patatin-like phospholipase family protein [Myxococcales bacterium]MCB9714622.1 patatin-like phospholipase family protein [Myxococcales bacterium]
MTNAAPQLPRDVAITFAGGGNRAFYQLGLLHHWGERLRPRLAAIAACSAGACVATLWLAGRETQTRAFWRARRQGVHRNFEWTRLLRGQRPTPHGPIYRDTLLCAYAEGGLELIRQTPFPVLVVTTSPPPLVPSAVGALVGWSAYNLEKRIRRDFVHPVLGQRLGFSAHVVDARRCQTPEELADLIIASSATPPFTPMGRFRGRTLLDGGLVDNAPASAAEAVREVRRNLVLLTRPYPPSCLGQKGSRLYVAPTREVPVDVWDYTRPELLDRTIEMGEREASVHDRALRRFLVR